MAYKFAWVQRETISVKLTDKHDTVDWQLDTICQSLEERIDTEETKTGEYYLARSDGDLGVPISQPNIDLADPFPEFPFVEINTVGLLYFSLILEATMPIIPSCQLFPDKTDTLSF